MLFIIILKTRLYLQENRPRVIATNISILVALWYKKVLEKKLVLKFYPKRTINTKAKYRLNTNSYSQYKSFGVTHCLPFIQNR